MKAALISYRLIYVIYDNLSIEFAQDITLVSDSPRACVYVRESSDDLS